MCQAVVVQSACNFEPFRRPILNLFDGCLGEAGRSERADLSAIDKPETGMSFGRWRQQLGVVLAVKWLAGGAETRR